jgi:hypothetical protein
MANATDSGSTLGLFNLGNGLIEIAALTSLVGSAAAESLALGDKGPAGLVWATMTTYIWRNVDCYALYCHRDAGMASR